MMVRVVLALLSRLLPSTRTAGEISARLATVFVNPGTTMPRAITTEEIAARVLASTGRTITAANEVSVFAVCVYKRCRLSSRAIQRKGYTVCSPGVELFKGTFSTSRTGIFATTTFLFMTHVHAIQSRNIRILHAVSGPYEKS